MSFNNDREYATHAQLSDWLVEFANKELQRGGSPFEDIKNLFQQNNMDAVEARVQELRKRVGLDQIEKRAATEDAIFGGFGDNRPDDRYDPKQLEKGIEVELEHTNDPEKAKEITKDHLEESKDFKDEEGGEYYDELEDMEEKIKEKLTAKYDLVQHLVSVANELEDEGRVEAAKVIDQIIKKLSKKEGILDERPDIIQTINTICSVRGGHIDAPAVMEMLKSKKLKDIKLMESDKDDIMKYIKQKLKDEKKEVKDEDDTGAAFMAFVVTEDDGNNDMFGGPTRL